MDRMRIRKRNKWKRIIFLTFLLLFSGIIVYSAFQYKQGTIIAQEGNVKEGFIEETEPFLGEEVKVGKLNVLLLGVDSRGEERSRTDTIMIAHYNQDTGQSKLISIMRDTYVNIPGHGNQKINAAYAFGGAELLRKTIKENFNIDINYYAVVDFEGFSKITDIIAPEGIKVDVPYEMAYGIGTTIHPGKQSLQGDKLLGYVRFRHDKLSDFGRVDRQQEVIGKLKDEALSIGTILQLPKLLGVIDPYVNTNLDTLTLLSLGKNMITNESVDLKTMRIPVNGSFTNERYNDVGEVLSINFEENKIALDDFLSS